MARLLRFCRPEETFVRVLPLFPSHSEFDAESGPGQIRKARRARTIACTTVALSAVGLVFTVRCFWIGLPTLAWMTLGAILLSLGVAVLFGALLYICSYAGGIESTDFSWLVVVPAVAALAVGLRSAWIWLVIVWFTTYAFWTSGSLFATDVIPIEIRGFHTLENRLGLSLALTLLTTMFVRGLRLSERRFSRVNGSLALEIENRKKAEAALRESEQSYRDLVENSPTMIYTHDLKGTVLSGNRALFEFLGCPEGEDLVGLDGSSFMLPSNGEGGEEYLERIQRDREASGLAEVITPSGETKLLEYHNTLRTEDVDQPVVRGMARDVTEQERARRALLRQVEQEELVSGIATRFVSIDGSELGPAIETGLGELGRFADVDWCGLLLLAERDKEIVETYTWTSEDRAISIPKAVGKSIEQFSGLAQRLNQLETVIVHDVEKIDDVAAEELKQLLGPDMKSALLVPLVGREGLLGVLTLVLASRLRRWIQENLVLGYISGYVFTSAVLRVRHEERTLRLENEVQEARKMESLGLVAGGIAHDFNNHLMGILGNAGLLREELMPGSEGWQAVQKIAESAQKAAHLTSQMLSFSGSANVVPEEVDVDDLLSRVVEQQRAALPEGVELDLWLSGSLPSVEADVGQIRQIARNLILNSCEAMENGSGRIQVRSGVAHLSPGTPANGYRPLKREPAPGSYVFIQISDSGCGIRSEDLTKVFDPFFSTRFKGRGLGLAAVHGIVRAHKGVIEVSSDAGSGTVMRILLPVAEETCGVEAVPTAMTKAPPVDQNPELQRRGAILVVDDEESVVQVIRRMLEVYGFEVRTASNEEQVIDLVRRDGADLKAILLDFTLPEGDPTGTLQEIRTNGLRAPVIMMSGFSREQVVERLGPDSIAGFLEKPFGSQVLLSELERVLEQ
jgi:PAS domain S-box-containing protein